MRNIEIKCRVRDHQRIESTLQRMGVREAGVLRQRDVFFHCPTGRLKLRLCEPGPPHLIHYQRADQAQLRQSSYAIAMLDDGEAMLRVLTAALGRDGEVRKVRRLYLIDNVRIHLDEVEGLGAFLEIEAVVDEAHPEDACYSAAQRLLSQFGIDDGDLHARAYVDLLHGRSDV